MFLCIMGFFVTSLNLGGAACYGEVVDGHYYVSTGPSCAKAVEVTSAQWWFSLILGYFILSTCVVTLVPAVVIFFAHFVVELKRRENSGTY